MLAQFRKAEIAGGRTKLDFDELDCLLAERELITTKDVRMIFKVTMGMMLKSRKSNFMTKAATPPTRTISTSHQSHCNLSGHLSHNPELPKRSPVHTPQTMPRVPSAHVFSPWNEVLSPIHTFELGHGAHTGRKSAAPDEVAIVEC